jgi:inward rectifier potassium channel
MASPTPSPRKKDAHGRSYQLEVVGARRVVGDWYHSLLRMTWTELIAFIAVAFLGVNALFALVYVGVGGIAHARPGQFTDAFYFSVQTMGTIGYGAMYPESNGANLVMVAESVVSLVITALATGLVFSRFARPVGRVAFSHYAVIAPMDGIPTLMIRVGNQRGNSIVEATVHLTLSRTIRTAEGVTFYKLIDLKLARDRSPAVQRSWTILHELRDDSPLAGLTPEEFAAEGCELMATISGTDDTSYQLVHARHQYENDAVLWGARHADVLSEKPNGDMILDIRRFDDVVPTRPTPSFPYPRQDDGRADSAESVEGDRGGEASPL